MIDPFFGGALGAASSLLGGFMGQNAAKEASDQEWKRQKKVLQNRVQWTVADANAAGIHPIYALGAPPFNYTPAMAGDGGLAAGFANAGQSLSEGIRASADLQQRLNHDMALLQLENQGLQNDMLRTQLRKANSPGSVGGNPAIQRTPWGNMKVTAPGAAQDAQNNYDQLVAAIIGTLFFDQDVVKNYPKGGSPRQVGEWLRGVIGGSNTLTGPTGPDYPLGAILP